MTGTAPELAASLTSDVDAEFLALVCSDEELLDAEFQAIVAGVEPPRRSAAQRDRQGDWDAGVALSAPSRGQDLPPPVVMGPTTGLERSPPAPRGRQPRT